MMMKVFNVIYDQHHATIIGLLLKRRETFLREYPGARLLTRLGYNSYVK